MCQIVANCLSPALVPITWVHHWTLYKDTAGRMYLKSPWGIDRQSFLHADSQTIERNRLLGLVFASVQFGLQRMAYTEYHLCKKWEKVYNIIWCANNLRLGSNICTEWMLCLISAIVEFVLSDQLGHSWVFVNYSYVWPDRLLLWQDCEISVPGSDVSQIFYSFR